jgi:hypothetical protein
MKSTWVAPVVQLADQIKWWDVQDDLVGVYGFPNLASVLQMARECRHPDAQYLVRPHFDPLAKQLYYHPVSSAELVKLQRLFELHAEMINRAKRAIMCWSMAGRRLRVVKDMRVVIAKMMWEGRGDGAK